MLKGNDSQQNEINKLALSHLDADFVKTNTEAKQALLALLNSLPNGKEYLDLASKYLLAEQNARLFEYATTTDKWNESRDAAAILLKQGGESLVWTAINGKNEPLALKAVSMLRNIGSKPSINLLEKIILDKKRSPILRAEATRSIGGSWDGENRVLELLKAGKISKELIPAAVEGVSKAWRRNVRTEAASYLGVAQTSSGKKMPPMAELVAMTGNPKNGIQVFQQNCAVCHQVNGEGTDFGPKLSEIGSKLSKEGQYLAILHPDAGISFGYEGWEVTLKDGTSLTGIIASKTETDVLMKFPGGTSQNLKTKDIKSMKQLPNSMMPTGLQDNMSTQELADLVEYLATLKKK